MHKIQKDCLIDFFKVINKKFDYAVMRNASELPFDNFSNDIDILIKETSFQSFEYEMKIIFLKHNFKRFEHTKYHGIECYTFYNIENEISHSLKIDLFFNIEGGGVIYYNFKDLIKYSIKNSNGISVFEPKIESYLTVFKILAAGGIPKEKYLNNFFKYNKCDENELLHKCNSHSLKKYIMNTIHSKKCDTLISRKKIVLETLITNIINNPLKSFNRLFSHYKIEFSRSFKTKYLAVFVGPDGSGKSSLIDMLVESSRLIFRSESKRFYIFHHRPHILPNIAHIFKKNISSKETFDLNFNPHSKRPSSAVISFFKLLYYVCDYILGYFIKILPLQRQNKFIIFDRYYFDFIVDQKRSAINLNKTLATFFYKVFIPKPNKILFVSVDSKVAYKRKKELPINVIKNINFEYYNLSKKLKNFDIISNIDLESTKNIVIKKYILLITNQINID